MSHLQVSVASATDVGLRRQQNEDSHGSWASTDPAELERRGVLLVVADGMGGALAGEVASRLAVQTVLRCYRETAAADPLEALYQALATANQVVHAESLRSPELGGMGTTCTAAVVLGHDLLVAHVGDSRLYVMQGGRWTQVTRDHSLVAQMVREGQLTAEQARVDPRRNVVTRSVGVAPQVEIDTQRLAGVLQAGDTLLLCSDGLHGLVADDELAAIAAGADLERAGREAIERANERGGPDNITVVLARLEMEGAPARVPPPAARRVDETLAQGPPGGAFGGGPDELPEEPPGPLPPRGHAAVAPRATGRSSQLLLWLIGALVVLLLAILGMVWIVLRMTEDGRALGG
jgi:protein phosphatase